MWQRLSKYLSKINSPLRPDEYVIQMAEKWATADKLAGRTVIIMGDFNKSDAALKSWADINGLYSLSRKLATAKNGEPFASFNGTSTVKPSHIDHIYLQQNAPFTLTSIGGLMNPPCSLITDHNPSWAGIQWPETPPPVALSAPSARILNFPDLPQDEETLDIFADSLDMQLPIIMAGSPPLSSLTPERAGKLQGAIVQASVTRARTLSAAATSQIGQGLSLQRRLFTGIHAAALGPPCIY
jgi:hypothetical protein